MSNDLESDSRILMKGRWENAYQAKLDDPERFMWEENRTQRIRNRRSAILTKMQKAIEDTEEPEEPVSIFAV